MRQACIVRSRYFSQRCLRRNGDFSFISCIVWTTNTVCFIHTRHDVQIVKSFEHSAKYGSRSYCFLSIKSSRRRETYVQRMMREWSRVIYSSKSISVMIIPFWFLFFFFSSYSTLQMYSFSFFILFNLSNISLKKLHFISSSLMSFQNTERCLNTRRCESQVSLQNRIRERRN